MGHEAYQRAIGARPSSGRNLAMVEKAAPEQRMANYLNNREAAEEARRKEERTADRARAQAAWAAEARRQEDLVKAREAQERAASDARQAAAQRQAENQQVAQVRWSQDRALLQAEVAALKVQLRTAQDLALTAPIADARVAAADALVYAPRLAAAERALAAHIQQQPRFGC